MCTRRFALEGMSIGWCRSVLDGVGAVFVDLIIKIWWVIPLIVIVTLLKLPVVKGMFGELLVVLMLRLFLSKDRYHRLHNVTLPTIDGTTQIDHVVVSEFGIFVIETKNMRGWIFGSEKQAQWTQKIFKKNIRFQNPLRQNFKHTKAVETVTGLESDRVHSVVVFVGDSTFKTPMPNNVVYGGGLVRFIKSFQELILSEEDVALAMDSIRNGKHATNGQTHKDHVARLKTRSDESASRLCPRCGEALVIRQVRKGVNAGAKFWGCSAYPRCRAVQNISV